MSGAGGQHVCDRGRASAFLIAECLLSATSKLPSVEGRLQGWALPPTPLPARSVQGWGVAGPCILSPRPSGPPLLPIDESEPPILRLGACSACQTALPMPESEWKHRRGGIKGSAASAPRPRWKAGASMRRRLCAHVLSCTKQHLFRVGITTSMIECRRALCQE